DVGDDRAALPRARVAADEDGAARQHLRELERGALAGVGAFDEGDAVADAQARLLAPGHLGGEAAVNVARGVVRPEGPGGVVGADDAPPLADVDGNARP